jgi:regulator of sigma E protease
MAILLTVLGISALILLHELGHYLAARACGMRVSCFSVGFGPTLLRLRGGHTVWQIGAIPLGGYVVIDGMTGDVSDEASPSAESPDSGGHTAARLTADDPHSYRNKPAWQRALVIAAGPAANWLICAALLAAVAVTSGVAEIDETQAVIGALQPAGAGTRGGLAPGDRVQRIDGTVVVDWPHLVDLVRARPEQPTDVEVVRGQTIAHLKVTPERVGSIGVIGATPHANFVTYPLGAGLMQGLRGANRLGALQAQGIAGLFHRGGSAQLTGLPGIFRVVSHQAQVGLARLAESLATLSIGLCFLNLLPVPELDGGRLVFLAVEAVRRRPLDERFEGMVHTAGFVLLMAVMVFVSARDLLRIF